MKTIDRILNLAIIALLLALLVKGCNAPNPYTPCEAAAESESL